MWNLMLLRKDTSNIYKYECFKNSTGYKNSWQDKKLIEMDSLIFSISGIFLFDHNLEVVI